MIIKTEICDLYHFAAWSGGVYAKDKICDAGKGEAFISELEPLYGGEMSDDELNNLLWFEPEYCFSLVGLDSEGNEPEETEDEAEDGNEETEGENDA